MVTKRALKIEWGILKGWSVFNFIMKIFKRDSKSTDSNSGYSIRYLKRLEASFYGICGKRWKYYRCYEVREEGIYIEVTKEEYDKNAKL